MVRANKILNNFMLDSAFADWVRNDRSRSGFYEVCCVDKNSPYEIDLTYGAYKWVIMDYEYGVVYKIDFNQSPFYTFPFCYWIIINLIK